MANKFKVNTILLGGQEVVATGNAIYINGISPYPYNNPNNYANSGNLQSTGFSLYQYITDTSGDLDGRLYQTGNNLYNLINTYTGYNNSNPSGFITNNQTGQFYPSSNPQNYSQSGNVELTGQSLQNEINILNNVPKVTGIYISGGNSHTGAVQFTGNNGISIIDSGNNLFVYTLPNFSKSITMDYPMAGDSITLFYTDIPMKIVKLITLLSGDTNQTLDFNLRLATGRNVSPYYSIFNNNQTTTSINTGTLFTNLDNRIISGNSYCYLDIISTGGNLYKYSQTLFYNYI